MAKDEPGAQGDLFVLEQSVDQEQSVVKSVNPRDYDKVIVAFSGGKDSLACVLHLLESGVSRDRIELWHHDIDGNAEPFMDWPVTAAYCRAVADALGLPIYFSWREGGFLREMLRSDAPTGGVVTQTPDGDLYLPSKGDRLGTRLKFPQVSASLSTRWCSSYLKIDVAARAITGQARFRSGNYLMVTGERAEESANRAKYAEVEPHRATTRARRVDQCRAVLHWPEAKVWEIIERHRIRPHPAYLIGLSRVSCMWCIFGSKAQWATGRAMAPAAFAKVAGYERQFGVTIRRDGSITQAADAGVPLEAPADLVAQATSETYDQPVILEPHETWVLPKGAFGEACGPT